MKLGILRISPWRDAVSPSDAAPSASLAAVRAARVSRLWRDPDSNRGHHDFQSCGLVFESALFAGLFGDREGSASVRVFPHFATVCRAKGPTAGSVGLFAWSLRCACRAALRPAAEVRADDLERVFEGPSRLPQQLFPDMELGD